MLFPEPVWVDKEESCSSEDEESSESEQSDDEKDNEAEDANSFSPEQSCVEEK